MKAARVAPEPTPTIIAAPSPNRSTYTHRQQQPDDDRDVELEMQQPVARDRGVSFVQPIEGLTKEERKFIRNSEDRLSKDKGERKRRTLESIRKFENSDQPAIEPRDSDPYDNHEMGEGLKSFLIIPKEKCFGFNKCYKLWRDYEFLTSALDREDVKAMLDMLLIVFTLIISFAVAHMFAFEPEHIIEADRRLLQDLYQRNVTDAELNAIYYDGYRTGEGTGCHWYESRQDSMLAGGQPPFGEWNSNLCFGEPLPSYGLFHSCSMSIALTGTVLFVGIIFYLTLIWCKPLEDEKTYETFIALSFPVLLFITFIGMWGIAEFFFSLGFGVYILFPRMNAGMMFYEYYVFLMLLLMLPAFFWLVVSMCSAYYASSFDHVEDGTAISMFQRNLRTAHLHTDRLVHFSQDKLLLYQMLKDAGIRKPGERLEVIFEVQQMAIEMMELRKRLAKKKMRGGSTRGRAKSRSAAANDDGDEVGRRRFTIFEPGKDDNKQHKANNFSSPGGYSGRAAGLPDSIPILQTVACSKRKKRRLPDSPGSESGLASPSTSYLESPMGPPDDSNADILNSALYDKLASPASYVRGNSGSA